MGQWVSPMDAVRIPWRSLQAGDPGSLGWGWHQHLLKAPQVIAGRGTGLKWKEEWLG